MNAYGGINEPTDTQAGVIFWGVNFFEPSTSMWQRLIRFSD
jgi:hypothetical protein